MGYGNVIYIFGGSMNTFFSFSFFKKKKSGYNNNNNNKFILFIKKKKRQARKNVPLVEGGTKTL